jgi:hypothetical protein
MAPDSRRGWMLPQTAECNSAIRQITNLRYLTIRQRPSYSNVFQLIPAYFLATRPSVQRIPAYSNIFQHIPAYSCVFPYKKIFP